MNRLAEFIKKSRTVSKILFVLWLVFSCAGGYGACIFFGLILLLPAYLIEYYSNPVFQKKSNKKQNTLDKRPQKFKTTYTSKGRGDIVLNGSIEQKEPIPIGNYRRNKFISDMAKYENTEGEEAKPVPFQQYWPTYDTMSKGQKEWYFYWRTMVRKGAYLGTPLSYIFVHIYEILSGYGWKVPQEGYDQLSALWKNYRLTYPELDRYMADWILDFACLHGIKCTSTEDLDFISPRQKTRQNVILDLHKEDRPLKLPFALIASLCDYSITDSKFYKEGNEKLIREAIPRVVALADAALIKESGKGILDTYGPKNRKKQAYVLFEGANCLRANERIELMVKEYAGSQALRRYLRELVRFSENVLREFSSARGRLRDVVMDEKTATLIRSFLQKEYFAKPCRSKEKAPEVKLDPEDIRRLRKDSDAVREALEVTEDPDEPKEALTDLIPIGEIFSSLPVYCRALLDDLHQNSWEMPYTPSAQVAIEKVNSLSERVMASSVLVIEGDLLLLEDDYRDEFDYVYQHLSDFEEAEEAEEADSLFHLALLSHELRGLLEALSPVQQEILKILLKKDGGGEKLSALAEAEFSMPEILLDEINDIATGLIGDILIDTLGDEPYIFPQYENELIRSMNQEVE